MKFRPRNDFDSRAYWKGKGGGGISHDKREKVFKRDNYRCVFCGTGGDHVELTIDHIKPKSKGGTGIMSNLQTMCYLCNQRKGNHYISPSELMFNELVRAMSLPIHLEKGDEKAMVRFNNNNELIFEIYPNNRYYLKDVNLEGWDIVES